MPRFGLAYSLSPKTVFRGGYGVYFDQLGITRQHVNLSGFNRATDLIASLDNGLTFLANVGNPLPERVISDQDRTHRLVVTALWELPFGRGRSFGGSTTGFLGKLIEGWQAQGIFQGQSGPPLGFGNAIFNGNLHDIPIPKSRRTIYRWFDVDTQFAAPNTNPVSTGFGTVTAESQLPRTIQFGLKLSF